MATAGSRQIAEQTSRVDRTGKVLAILGIAWPVLTCVLMVLYALLNRPDPNPFRNPNSDASDFNHISIKVLLGGVAVSFAGVFMARRLFRAIAVAGILLNLLIACKLALTFY